MQAHLGLHRKDPDSPCSIPIPLPDMSTHSLLEGTMEGEVLQPGPLAAGSWAAIAIGMHYGLPEHFGARGV